MGVGGEAFSLIFTSDISKYSSLSLPPKVSLLCRVTVTGSSLSVWVQENRAKTLEYFLTKWRHFYEMDRRKKSRSGNKNYICDSFRPKMWKMLEEKQHLLLRAIEEAVY